MSVVRTATLSTLLVVVSFGIALVIGEVALRMVGAERYYVYPPGMQKIFKPIPELMPGVSGDARFLVNQSGMRGDPYPVDNRIKILAIGGSTTICSFLDQAEAWPQLLQEKLNNAGRTVWVGNVGRSGHHTRNHMLHVEKLLNQHTDIDLVIILVGANDMSMRLQRDVDFRLLDDEEPVYRAKLIYDSFAIFPISGLPETFFYKNTEIYRKLRQIKRNLTYRAGDTQVEDERGEAYKWRRDNRANASRILTELPDLTPSLDEYRQNLNRIVDMVRKRGMSIVFLTQPYLWRADLPNSLEGLLWLGGVGDYQNVGGQPYYSAAALDEAMRRYNRTLLDVCSDRGIDCLDLAPRLAPDTTSFSDDVHFNEQGARTVADAVAEFLLEHELLD